MNLQEMQSRLKKTTVSKEEDVWAVNSLYILLDLDKDDFCKLIDAVGYEKLVSKRSWYERLEKAEMELKEKECYLSSKSRLAELEIEREQLERIVDNYKPI